MKIAIVGGGWAGFAAAVHAVRAKHRVVVFEGARQLGGRARGLALAATLADGSQARLDNGQHLLIGAYQECLRLMRWVGVDVESSLLRMPLSLLYPDGSGLQLNHWPAPWDAAIGMARARGWSWAAKLSLMRLALSWRIANFTCAPQATVAQLCQSLHPQIFSQLIEPLCVAALNTPAHHASAQVFLRVLQDSLFAAAGGSNLLLPRVDLSKLFPNAAARWLHEQGSEVRVGKRVVALEQSAGCWQVQGEKFDNVVLAVGVHDALAVLQTSALQLSPAVVDALDHWCETSRSLHFESIATVYGFAPGARLRQPMMALRSTAQFPAQFAFDRGQLSGEQGLIAMVVSAASGDRQSLQTRALAQAQAQLGLRLSPVQTICERRATFACTPACQRPTDAIAPGLWACGDYVQGPYPATLEGAVRSAISTINRLNANTALAP